MIKNASGDSCIGVFAPMFQIPLHDSMMTKIEYFQSCKKTINKFAHQSKKFEHVAVISILDSIDPSATKIFRFCNVQNAWATHEALNHDPGNASGDMAIQDKGGTLHFSFSSACICH